MFNPFTCKFQLLLTWEFHYKTARLHGYIKQTEMIHITAELLFGTVRIDVYHFGGLPSVLAIIRIT